MAIWWGRPVSRFALVWMAGAFTIGPLFAQPPVHDRGGYLQGGPLGYSSPPAPDNGSSVGRADLDVVRAAQRLDEARRREAYEDAAAYTYDQLLSRFSEAAGTSLNLHTRPILAHMLERLLIDTGNYVSDVKHLYPRERPYREDPSITPCETDFLYSSDVQSYPSGHAANGYIAALALAEVLADSFEPDRHHTIIARGIRYGENRVVCGVHHASDVREGQVIARNVFDQASMQSESKADLTCAKEENKQSPAYRQVSSAAPYSADCRVRFTRYVAEAADTISRAASAAASLDAR